MSVSLARKGRHGGQTRKEHFPTSERGAKLSSTLGLPNPAEVRREEGSLQELWRRLVARLLSGPGRWGSPDGPSRACPPKFRVSALFWIGLCLSWGQELV